MKKKYLFSLLSAAAVVGTSVVALSSKPYLSAKATLGDVESASAQDMVVRTALNGGKAYSGKLVDYQVVHGNVANKSINAFTTYEGNANEWTGSLGTSADSAYGNHWSFYSLKNDGVIFKVVAKADINISISQSSVSGWVDGANLTMYKEAADGTISTLKTTALTDSSTTEDFDGNFDIASCETFYWEFRFEWDGSHRNTQTLPSFTFTEIEHPAPSLETVTASGQDIIVRTALNNGGSYTDASLVDYQAVHGNVTNGTINAFTTFSSDAGTWKATLGAQDADDCYANHYKLWSQANDGFIFKVTAKSYVNVSVDLASVGGWPDDAFVSIYKYDLDGKLSTISSNKVFASSPTSDFVGSADLYAGEIFYWEFKFEWTSWRNLDGLPSFAFTEKENTVGTLSSYILESDTPNQCQSKYWEAKKRYNSLSSAEKSTFQTSTNSRIVSARERYLAWAVNQGDANPYDNTYGASNKTWIQNNLTKTKEKPMWIIAITTIASFVGMGSLFFYRKHKKQ